ncbi:MAG: Meiosis-specific serine/threonine-protein kinase mek1 [Claussenomyces sp. TS43310]|nr:MAG: Meiosis-specific serine/threonine-protein kinase mek1 [Claussenomyces sp. TS43310]
MSEESWGSTDQLVVVASSSAKSFSDITLDDQLVSKSHFRIYSIVYDPDDPFQYPPLIYCEDLQTINGTYVNNTLIGKMGSETSTYLLSDGDTIFIRPHWAFSFHQLVASERRLDQFQRHEIDHFRDLYEISDRVLGNGSWGTVVLAHDVLTKEQLACKIVDLRVNALESLRSLAPQNEAQSRNQNIHLVNLENPGKASERTQRAWNRAVHEVYLLRDLDHPNVIRMKRAFYSQHTLYAFFELATGGDLFSYLMSQGGRIPELHARVITRQLANAVNFIHSRGIAHRDIKPENVLTMRTDIGHRVVLTDFGYATSFHVPTGRMMSMLGTGAYAAPEVYGKHGYTQAVDLWSLGIVLVCLFTGDILISSEDRRTFSQIEIAAKLVLDDPEMWNRRPWHTVGIRPKDLIKKLLVISPADRLTALETVNHYWFRRPVQVAEALRRLDERALRFWKPRAAVSRLIQVLPDILEVDGNHDKKANSHGQSQNKERFPDTTASAYFGLDRHLQARVPTQSQQKRRLDQLTRTGSQPAATTPSELSLQLVPHPQIPATEMAIREVDAGDMFRNISCPKEMSHLKLVETNDSILLAPNKKARQDNISGPCISLEEPVMGCVPSIVDSCALSESKEEEPCT